MPRASAALLAALACAGSIALAQESLAPPPGMATEGLPPIAAALATKLRPYAGFTRHTLVAWHPSRREMLVGRGPQAALAVVGEPGVRPMPLDEVPDAAKREWSATLDASPALQKASALLRDPARFIDLSASEDGKRVAYVEVASPVETHVWVLEVATGARRRVTRPARGEPVSYRLPRFLKDGRSLLATSDRDSEYRRIVVLPPGGGPEKVLTGHLKFDIDELQVSGDGARVAFTTNEGGSHALRFLDGVTLKEQPRPPLFNGVIGGLAWRPNSAEVGFHLTTARSAGDVFSYEVKENRLARWTNGNAPDVNVSRFPEARVVRWKGIDGVEATALQYAPPDRFTGKRPVIVDLRGGAHSQARADFQGERNFLMTELGIAWLYPNLRGAPGFGKSYRRLGLGPRRDESGREVAALIEWIRAQPDLDGDKVLLMGNGPGAAAALSAASLDGVKGVAAFAPSSVPWSVTLERPTLVTSPPDRSREWRETLAAARARGVPAWWIDPGKQSPGLASGPGAEFLSSAIVEFAQKVLLR